MADPLGSRAALDGVTEQYKNEIKDPTVARVFDPHRFAITAALVEHYVL